MIKYIQSIKESNKSMANNKNKLVDSKILENNFYYNTFQKLSTLWRELSWNHYKLLIRVKDKQEEFLSFKLGDRMGKKTNVLKETFGDAGNIREGCLGLQWDVYR